MTIKIGMLGCGSIARKRHLPEIAANLAAEIYAVCDTVRERAAKMGERYGARVFDDYRDVLAVQDIDAVYVCTTNASHAEITIDALKSGKHVLCEKPMATSIEDARAMIKAAGESGKFLMIGHNQRLAPAHIKAKEILQSGRLGRVESFRTVFGHHGCEYWAIDGKDTWFFDRKYAHLGSTGDLGIHKADLLRWLLDERFTEASAFVEIRGKRNGREELINVDDNAVCLLKGESGVIGTLVSSWTYKKEDNSTVLYCENGILRLYSDPVYQLVVDYADGSSEYHTVGDIQTNAKQTNSGVSDLFIHCIVNGKKPEISGEEGLEALKIIIACLEAAKEKKVAAIQQEM